MAIIYNGRTIRNPLIKILFVGSALFLGLGLLALLAVIILPLLGLVGLVVSGALATVGLVLVLLALVMPLCIVLGLLLGLVWLPFALARRVLKRLFCG